MKKLVLVILILLLIVANVWVIYNGELQAVSKNDKRVEFVVSENETYSSIATKLKSKNLIRSELAYKVYLKLNPPKNYLLTGKYYVSENMSVAELVKVLSKDAKSTAETVRITFKEGKNMRHIAALIADKTDNTVDDVMNAQKNVEYLNSLISEYWFLTDDIKKKDIYYPLEGYLFPDTYEFLKSDPVETIFKKMLDQMSLKLEPYKLEIENSKYSIHELITLASIVELEGASSNDRAAVAGVFYNRLKDGWFLGSDVTTFYAEKMDNWSVGLTRAQLDACNAYNTRGTCFKGLPVGPICNPGMESLASVFEPLEHNNYYFVADCNGKTYLSKNDTEHHKTINQLKASNLWCEN